MHTIKSLIGIAAVVALSLAGCASEPSGTSAAVDSDTDSSSPEPASAEPDPIAEDEPADAEPEPTSEPTPDGPTVAQIGEILEVSEGNNPVGSITVAGVETSNRAHSRYGDGPKNGTFVIFTVELIAEATFDVYDGDFYVLTEDGTRYDVNDGNSMDAVDYDDTLGWVELNADEKKSGLLAFDLPAEHGRLAYAPNYDGGPIGIWEF